MPENNPPEHPENALARLPVADMIKTPRTVAGISAGTLAVAAIATGHIWLLIPAGVLALVTGGLAVVPFVASTGLVPASTALRPGIGMGASVHSGAEVAAGARIEMGSTVCSGAIVQDGAVVGMGSTVESGAIIESNAVVGWGATVRSGAVVRRGASIGAGSTVESGAIVQEGMRIGAGSTVAGNRGRDQLLPRMTSSLAQGGSLSTSAIDPRDIRVDELSDQFEAELKKVSSSVDEFLRNPRETVESVRKTCHELLRKERDLRLLANPADQERLNREAAALEARIAAETDDVTRRQFQGAVKAITDQREQRALVLRNANRLEAEQTRLVWTLEGLVAHMIRLRTTEASGSPELDRELSRLREEVSSVAGAMEHVQAMDVAVPSPAAEGSFESASSGTTRQRERS